MDTVTCGLCGRQSDRDAAIDAGWQPYWWAPDPATCEMKSDGSPACPACARRCLADDGAGDGLVLPPAPDAVAGPGPCGPAGGG